MKLKSKTAQSLCLCGQSLAFVAPTSFPPPANLDFPEWSQGCTPDMPLPGNLFINGTCAIWSYQWRLAQRTHSRTPHWRLGWADCGCFCHCVESPASPHPLWISEFPAFVKSVVLTGLFLREVEGNREDNQMWPQLWVPLTGGTPWVIQQEDTQRGGVGGGRQM